MNSRDIIIMLIAGSFLTLFYFGYEMYFPPKVELTVEEGTYVKIVNDTNTEEMVTVLAPGEKYFDTDSSQIYAMVGDVKFSDFGFNFKDLVRGGGEVTLRVHILDKDILIYPNTLDVLIHNHINDALMKGMSKLTSIEYISGGQYETFQKIKETIESTEIDGIKFELLGVKPKFPKSFLNRVEKLRDTKAIAESGSESE